MINVTHMFMYLNTQCLVGGTVWGKLWNFQWYILAGRTVLLMEGFEGL